MASILNNLKNRRDYRELGFGTRVVSQDSRYINRDGTFNVAKTGLSFFKRASIYHDLISMKVSHFILLIAVFYLLANLIFACIYFLIGTQHLAGIDPKNTLGSFWEAFFFSSQTITTVGYGRISPTGMITNVVAGIESLIGLMAFALATGLLYGRFSRPKADLVFSENAIIAPYRDSNALMFRVAHTKKHVLNNVEVQVVASMNVTDDNGNTLRRFFPLKLELDKINFLSLTWTIVHAIDDDSPLRGMANTDIKTSDLELMILLRGFDDTFSQDVHKRSSYKHNEVVWGAKFVSILGNVQHGKVILDLSRIGEYEKAELNDVVVV